MAQTKSDWMIELYRFIIFLGFCIRLFLPEKANKESRGAINTRLEEEGRYNLKNLLCLDKNFCLKNISKDIIQTL